MDFKNKNDKKYRKSIFCTCALLCLKGLAGATLGLAWATLGLDKVSWSLRFFRTWRRQGRSTTDHVASAAFLAGVSSD
jgi:hypothetical protein